MIICYIVPPTWPKVFHVNWDDPANEEKKSKLIRAPFVGIIAISTKLKYKI